MAEATIEKNAHGVIRKTFRNPLNKRFYLRNRTGGTQDHVLGPGEVVQALDEQEEKLLEGIGLIDVAKETPPIARTIEDLQSQLAAAKDENAALRKDKESLEGKLGRPAPAAAAAEAPVKAPAEPPVVAAPKKSAGGKAKK